MAIFRLTVNNFIAFSQILIRKRAFHKDISQICIREQTFANERFQDFGQIGIRNHGLWGFGRTTKDSGLIWIRETWIQSNIWLDFDSFEQRIQRFSQDSKSSTSNSKILIEFRLENEFKFLLDIRSWTKDSEILARFGVQHNEFKEFGQHLIRENEIEDFQLYLPYPSVIPFHSNYAQVTSSTSTVSKTYRRENCSHGIVRKSRPFNARRKFHVPQVMIEIQHCKIARRERLTTAKEQHVNLRDDWLTADRWRFGEPHCEETAKPGFKPGHHVSLLVLRCLWTNNRVSMKEPDLTAGYCHWNLCFRYRIEISVFNIELCDTK